MDWRCGDCFRRRVLSDGHISDWRDAAAYARLLEADRSIFAWEWLRRDSDYRRAFERRVERHAPEDSCGEAGAWGLHAFARPDLPAPLARPVWRAEVHAPVLTATAGKPRAAEDAFELGRWGALATVIPGPGDGEHLLLSDGLRVIRIDIVGESVGRGAVELRYSMSGLVSAERPLLTLRRLLAFWRTGSFARSLHPPEPRARRWILMLRACDALAAGAGQRDIAEGLLSARAGGPRWRNEAASLRCQAQRLVRAARRMGAGGYRELLL